MDDVVNCAPWDPIVRLVVTSTDSLPNQFEQFHDVEKVLQQFARLEAGTVASAIVEVAKKEKETSVIGKGRLYTGENEVMGEMLPFADPMWMQDWYNPWVWDYGMPIARREAGLTMVATNYCGQSIRSIS